MLDLLDFDQYINNSETSLDEQLKEEDKILMGKNDVIEVVGKGKLNATLDTGNGAKSSAITTSYVKVNESNKKVVWDFKGDKITSEFIKWATIKHGSKKEQRPVIKLDLKIGKKVYRDCLVNLRLVETSILICADLLSDAKIVVDPSKTENTEIENVQVKK